MFFSSFLAICLILFHDLGCKSSHLFPIHQEFMSFLAFYRVIFQYFTYLCIAKQAYININYNIYNND